MTQPYPPRPGQPAGPPPTLTAPTAGYPNQPGMPTTRSGPAGWPPPMGPPGSPPSSPGGPTGPSRRTWLLVGIAAVVIAAVALTLVFTAGGSHTATGHATTSPDPKTVAQTFLRLETARYNAGTQAPDPTRAEYGSVSCRADLAQMKAGSGNTLPPAPPSPHYSFAIDSITSTSGGRLLMRATRTDNTTGDQGDGLFYIQRESGAWKICGLFDSTQPPDNAGDGPGGAGSSGGAAPPQPSAGSPPGGGQSASGPQGFLSTFAQAVSSGLVGTAASSICVDASSLDSAVLGWTNAHAHVQVQTVDTSGGPAGASARIQVSTPDQDPATYGLVLQPQSGGWCIEDVQHM